jgi:hypothetical protein
MDEISVDDPTCCKYQQMADDEGSNEVKKLHKNIVKFKVC